MDGQSHRAKLSHAVQEQGGQQYASSMTVDFQGDKFSSDSPTFRSDHSEGFGRGVRSLAAGRGGGIIGTRGRGDSKYVTNVENTGYE